MLKDDMAQGKTSKSADFITRSTVDAFQSSVVPAD